MSVAPVTQLYHTPIQQGHRLRLSRLFITNLPCSADRQSGLSYLILLLRTSITMFSRKTFQGAFQLFDVILRTCIIMFSWKIVHAGRYPAVFRSCYPPIVIMFSLETVRCEPVGPAGMNRPECQEVHVVQLVKSFQHQQ